MKQKAHKTMAVGRAKTHFLSLVSEVAENGTTLVLTKRGKVVAHIVPPPKGSGILRPIRGAGKGYMEITGDIISPAAPESDWKILNE